MQKMTDPTKKRNPQTGLVLPVAIYVLFFAPLIAFAAPQTFAQLAGMVIDIINPLVALLISAAVLIFFFSVIRYIYSAGSEAKGNMKDVLVWSVVAIFVLVSVWGLARLVSSIFLGSAASSNRLDPSGSPLPPSQSSVGQPFQPGQGATNRVLTQ